MYNVQSWPWFDISSGKPERVLPKHKDSELMNKKYVK